MEARPTVYQEGDTLPSGRKTEEVARLARLWWDNTGRHLIGREFNQNQDAPRVRAARAGAPGIVIRASKGPLLRDGILDGTLWFLLTDKEKALVMAAFEVYKLSPAGQALAQQQDEDAKVPEIALRRQ